MEDEGWRQIQAQMCQVVRVLGMAPFQRRSVVVATLVSEGLDPERAWDLATFLPVAYLRLLVARRFGGMFPDTFVLENLDGSTQELGFADQPAYQECLRFAKAVFALGPDAGAVQAVVTHSFEFRQMNRILNEGETDPGSLRLEPAVLRLADDYCEEAVTAAEGEGVTLAEGEGVSPADSGRAWWEFWK